MEHFESWADDLISGVRASGSWKRRTREELLSHLNEARKRLEIQGLDEASAVHAAIVQMGDKETLRAQLQGTVPAFQRVGMMPIVERRDNESGARFALRMALYVELLLLLVLCATFGGCLYTKGLDRATRTVAMVALVHIAAFPTIFFAMWSDIAFYQLFLNGRVFRAVVTSVMGSICAAFFFITPLILLSAREPSIGQIARYLLMACCCTFLMLPLLQLADGWRIRRWQPWRIKERYRP
jgi:hypothetical protein